MVLVTCAALATALANPNSAGTYTLQEDCRSANSRPVFDVRTVFAQPVTVVAKGRTVFGLRIQGGGNLIWRGGTIEAPNGSGMNTGGAGPPHYGVLMTGGARNVRFESVTFTNARKAIVFGGARGLVVDHSRCEGEVEDCLIASNGSGIKFTNNIIGPFKKLMRACTLPDNMVDSLSKPDCTARGGSWRDGWHSDVLQMRNGVSDVYAAFNVIDTQGHGLTQMAKADDAPIRNVRIHANKIRAGRHGITLGSCDGCLIDGNTLETSMGHLKWRAVIMPGQAKACGNTVPSGGGGRDPC